jgi:HAD superfamily hydrolase (TIGR01549 family)
MAGKPLLLFDMDGTLIVQRGDAPDRALIHSFTTESRKLMKRIALSYGVPEAEVEPLNRMAHIWNKARGYAESHGFKAETIDGMMSELDGAFQRQEELEHSNSFLPPGNIEALEALFHASHPMGVVTTASRASYERLSSSDEFGCFGRFFRYSVTRGECVYIKPDPEPIIRILNLFGRSDFIYVGDSDHDAEAARSAGGRFVLLNTMRFNEDVIGLMRPEGVIDSLKELPATISGIMKTSST